MHPGSSGDKSSQPKLDTLQISKIQISKMPTQQHSGFDQLEACLIQFLNPHLIAEITSAASRLSGDWL